MEQLLDKREVVGSSPTLATNFNARYIQLVEGWPHKPIRVGSTPTLATIFGDAESLRSLTFWGMPKTPSQI